jgi:hypothetical protein
MAFFCKTRVYLTSMPASASSGMMIHIYSLEWCSCDAGEISSRISLQARKSKEDTTKGRLQSGKKEKTSHINPERNVLWAV